MFSKWLPTDENEYGAQEKDRSEPFEKIAEDLFEPMGGRRRGCIFSVLDQSEFDLLFAETPDDRSR